jgi:hypothetical protein
MEIIRLQETLTFQKEAFAARSESFLTMKKFRRNCGRARKEYVSIDETHAAFVAGCACCLRKISNFQSSSKKGTIAFEDQTQSNNKTFALKKFQEFYVC